MNTTSANYSEFHKLQSHLGCSEQGEIEEIKNDLKYIDVN